jgi:hypothetical protein
MFFPGEESLLRCSAASKQKPSVAGMEAASHGRPRSKTGNCAWPPTRSHCIRPTLQRSRLVPTSILYDMNRVDVMITVYIYVIVSSRKQSRPSKVCVGRAAARVALICAPWIQRDSQFRDELTYFMADRPDPRLYRRGQNEDCESEGLTFCKRTSMHPATLQNTIGPNFRHPDSRHTPPANLTWKPAILFF